MKEEEAIDDFGNIDDLIAEILDAYHLDPEYEDVQVKASSGIRTYEDAIALIEAGAERLGTSSGIAIIEGAEIVGAL